MSQQLVKKGANGKHENVMPKSWIEAIKDKSTGQTLVEILQGFNMYFLPYNGNTSATRCLVPTILRKKGLWITYVKYDGNAYTEWYAADEIDDTSWGDSSNWRVGNNTLVGDITISANGNWVINGTETEFKAVGEKGNTPLVRFGSNNKFQVSYNNGEKWLDVSDSITNNLRIKKYIGINESLPTSGIEEGTIYMKGPYYAEDDTLNDNPIYRMWVYAWKGDTLAWQDNGEFTSITAGIVQETGNSETEVMSQKAVTEKLSEVGSKVLNIETKTPEYTLSNGYINTNGGIGSAASSNWMHSNPIPLSVGESIIVYCKATSAIAVVSISNEDGSRITPKLFGKDGDNYLYYSFVANQDSYVVVSFQTDSKSADYQIFININQDNAAILESLSNLGGIMGGDLPSSITDLNDIPIGTSYLLTSKREESNLAHAPYYPFSGAIHTLSVNKDNPAGSIQIVAKDPGELWVRTLWASWSNWFRLSSVNNLKVSQGGNILPMYNNIVFIGDSLTWCQVYTDTANKISRRAKVTYPEIVCKLSGLDCDVNKFVAADGSKLDNESGILPNGYSWNNECNVFASKGYSSSKWWEIYSDRLFERENTLYIIYLGTNGGLTDTIDADCQGDDISTYANTNTGCYGKILKTLNNLGSKAILVKIYDSSSQDMTNETNNVIEKFGERYNMPVVDNAELADFCYRCTPDKTQTGGVHYNDLGYAKFASNLIGTISNMSTSMSLRLI